MIPGIGVHKCKDVGFALPNYFIFIGYLITGGGANPSGSATVMRSQSPILKALSNIGHYRLYH